MYRKIIIHQLIHPRLHLLNISQIVTNKPFLTAFRILCLNVHITSSVRWASTTTFIVVFPLFVMPFNSDDLIIIIDALKTPNSRDKPVMC